jgi:membrane protease YdiL (CAAX protease family)
LLERWALLDNQSFERINVYDKSGGSRWPRPEPSQFQIESGNADFRPTILTWVNLGILLLIYPAISLTAGGQKTLEYLRDITQPMLLFMLVTTVMFQWMVFLINYGGVYTERTRLRGLGLKKIRLVDFGWAAAFLLASNLILAGLAWFLAQIGLPMPGEIQMLIPTETSGKLIWVIVALTAGFCEEIAFRGYIMTRLRLLAGLKSWVIPAVVSALVFGSCHYYQGLPGFIVISVYGMLFALLYIRTGSLWPCIIAHFFQDFSGLFFPQ